MASELSVLLAGNGGALDSLDLAGEPPDNRDVFDRVVQSLLDGSIDINFKQTLGLVYLVPQRDWEDEGWPEEWLLPASRILSWLRNKKGVKSIQNLSVIDGACGGDQRIRAALWDPRSERALFSGIDTFIWIAPNISIRTVELVAPTVKNLCLLWDGCSRVALEAWEADLKDGKLQGLRFLIISLRRYGNQRAHRCEVLSSELSMFIEAVTKEREVEIKVQEADDEDRNHQSWTSRMET